MSRTQTLSPHTIDISAHARNKKNAMTGGGRAWREDEEAYLLRTRLQKMPYKHIAAHLNKTELACRLHYHQLSHGSSRRKRTASTSSGSDRCSPVLPSLSLSPSPSASSASATTAAAAAAAAAYDRVSRSISPPRQHHHRHQHHHHQHQHRHHPGRFAMTPPPQLADVQLPGLVVLGGTGGCSPPVRAAPTPLLPKPAAMVSRASSPLGYPPTAAVPEQQQQSLPPLRRPSSAQHHLPLPSAHHHSPAHVDLHRLQAAYAAHRDKFWDRVAADYGCSAGPAALETAWRSGRCCGGGGAAAAGAPVGGPPASPKEDGKMVGASRDKTRISSIISMD